MFTAIVYAHETDNARVIARGLPHMLGWNARRRPTARIAMRTALWLQHVQELHRVSDHILEG